jgi:Tol biopolymer transport system component
MKKVFLISSIILGFTLLLLGVYNFAFRNNVNNPRVENTKTIEVKSQPSAPITEKEEFIKSLTDEKIMSPTYDSKDNSVLYFVPRSREIKKVSLDTSSSSPIMTLSGEPLHAVWSPLQTQALVEIKTIENTKWYLVDIDKKTELPLKDGMEMPIWTNMGDRIVYKYYDAKTKERSINIANPDGSDWKKIAESPFKNMSADVMPQGSLLMFWNQGNAFEETSLRSVSLIGGDVKTLFSGKFGADYAFSPDGQKILVSSTDQKGGSSLMLGMLLNQGTQYQNLLIPTMVSKVAWAKNGKSIYYALPGSLPDGSVMPNDYFSKPILTQDTFWKVNIETGEKKRLVEMKDITRSYDVSALLIDDNETMLTFVNRADGKLYRIKL